MKCKKEIKCIVGLTLFCILILFSINVSFAANTAKVNVETANLREQADSNSKILTLLPIDQEVEIIEKVENWYKVKVDGITGYLREDIITVDNKSEETPVQTNPTPNEAQQEIANQGQEDSNNEKEQEQEQVNISNKMKVKADAKLKIIPVINATNIVDVKQGEEVTIIEKINNWVCVEIGLTRGWIRAEQLEEIKEEVEEPEKTEEQEPEKQEEVNTEVVAEPEKLLKTLYINTELVNMRKEASTSSEVVARLAINTEIGVYGEQGDWYKVKVNGNDGYISKSLLSENKQEITTTSRGSDTLRTNSNEVKEVNVSTKGSTIVETAKKYIGSKYTYGGATPSGFDCSGFTTYVYNQHGINLNRTALGQFSNGVAIQRSDLQPGDLVMFGPSSSGINHVGIYIGGGQIVHSANPSRGVTTDTIESGYYNSNYVGARRVSN